MKMCEELEERKVRGVMILSLHCRTGTGRLAMGVCDSVGISP